MNYDSEMYIFLLVGNITCFWIKLLFLKHVKVFMTLSA
jgi:hypothetical protein